MLNDDSEASNTPRKHETYRVLDKEIIESVVSANCTLKDVETLC